MWPTLYKHTSTGAVQQWTISVDGSTIVTLFGQVGGKIQATTDVVTAGKNLGKKNATTPAQQAALEAEAKYTKQLKKGYVTSLSMLEAGEVEDVIEGGIFPMLAQKYSERGHHIVFPALAQPKSDGHRCVAILKDGKCTLWSRTRKPINSVPHIAAALEAQLGWLPEVALDGELYNHGMKDQFERLTSLVRQESPKPGHEDVQYHIYDVVTAVPFSHRAEWLRANLKETGPIRLVETVPVADEDELMVTFERFRAEGYEGAMVRNHDGLYVHKRSNDLQKIKEFEDSEYEIIDVEEGRGKLAGHAIFVCDTGAFHFRAKMKGELAELKKIYDDRASYIGKFLTVKYQGLSRDGIPRFPVGIRVRSDV